MLSKFSVGNCTGSRVLTPVNSTREEQAEKLTAEVKQAPSTEATVVPSSPTPDPVAEAVAPAPAVAQVPAVPAGDAVQQVGGAEKPPESGVKAVTASSDMTTAE